MRRLLSLFAFAFLVACVSTPGPHIDDQMLAPGVTLSLPASPPFGAGLDVVQIVQAGYEGREQLIQSFLQTDASRLVLVMTVPSGPRIMRIDWSDGRITAKKEAIAPAALKPERMVADVFLVYASHDAIVRALHGATVVDASDGTRRIRASGHDVILIKRPTADVWSGSATLSNLAYGYRLSIQGRRMSP